MKFKNGRFTVKLSCLKTNRFQGSNFRKLIGNVKEKIYKCETHYYRIVRLIPGFPYYIYISERPEKGSFRPLFCYGGEHAFAYSVKDCETTIKIAEEGALMDEWLFGNNKNQNK